MLGASDDLVLQSLAQIAEIVAVSGDAHNQAAVLFGVLLGGPQGVGIDNVELDVMAVQGEIGTHQADEFVQSIIGSQHLGGEFLVEQGAAGAGVIHLGDRTDHCGRSAAVGALDRGNAFG